MRRVPRTSIAARVRQPLARLAVELLECRPAPAVVTVNATADVHPIDPNIYGTAFATTAQLQDLNIPLNRNGGNASDTYSYAQDATNRGSDWYFESIASGGGNGQGMDAWINETLAGGARPSVTLNLFDWAAKNAVSSTLGSFPVNVYGAQQGVDPWNTNLGNGVRTNGTRITGNDPNIAYVPNSPAVQQSWVQHLISTHGNSLNGGVQYYTLGNEPGLWHETHRDIHPNGVTHTELLSRVVAYASMVKSLDPNAKILGFEEWGWTNYFINGADSKAENWGATYDGLNFQTWLLNQMHAYDTTHGTRLLDYFTLHFYPQGGQFSDDVSSSMQLLRNRSTRSLWDPNYVDESWINTTGINGGRVNLINMMKGWVNTHYPGTKLGITEYNWGAEGHMNGATTQADIWGIFGREGLDLANRWTTPATDSPAYLAMKMYRNYDGNDSTFGEIGVSAAVANPDQVSAFASVRASDGALTVMVVNKNLYSAASPTTPITVNLSNFAAGTAAQEWQLAATNPADQTAAAITHLPNVAISGNSFTVNVPAQSVTLFVIPAATNPDPEPPAAPSGLTATAVSPSQINLTWTDNSNNEAGFVVERATNSTFTAGVTTVNLAANATSYSAAGLAAETTYWFRVRATNAEGASANSNAASATTQTPPPAPVNGLRATYFNNANFTGATVSRIDPTVNFRWDSSPAPDIAANTFSVRWTGQVQAVESGTYRFRTVSDQGVRLWVNGRLVIDNWTAHAATANTSAAITLVAGQKYDIKMQHYDNSGVAVARLQWQRPGQSTFEEIPQAQLFAAGDGLRAVYFDNADFTGPTVTRIDPTVNFNWGMAPARGIGPDAFSARWTGQVQAIEAGAYTFRTRSNDGVRLWVNGQLLIDNWTEHAATTDTGTITLAAGEKYEITLEYYDNAGRAVMQLEWMRPGHGTFAVIPRGKLFSA